MTILKPDKSPKFFSPFGPTMGYYKMSQSMVQHLNESMDKKLDDFSDYLVGKVSQELHFDKDTRNFAANNLLDFILEYHKYTRHRNSMGLTKLDESKTADLNIISAWFVRQFENEYNPTHWHGGHISGAGFLKLPKSFGETKQKKTNGYSGGNLQLIHGSTMFMCDSVFNIKPEVGDFYFFPNYLMHAVFPFKDSKEERRSISFNAHIDENIYNVYE